MQAVSDNKLGVGGAANPRPDPEVRKARRRQFSAEYKLRILEEADACAPGELGALLRREGLYSPYLTAWRRERERGKLAALAPKKRGRRGAADTPECRRIAELERTVQKLEREKQMLEVRVKRADLLLDIQKKASELLGIPLSPPPSDGSDS